MPSGSEFYEVMDERLSRELAAVQDRASIYAAALAEIAEPSSAWFDPFANAQRVARQALDRAATNGSSSSRLRAGRRRGDGAMNEQERDEGEPHDVVRGADPSVEGGWERKPGWRAWCACGWEQFYARSVDADDALTQHREFGHPARRNPDIGCQATPPWDHDRW